MTRWARHETMIISRGLFIEWHAPSIWLQEKNREMRPGRLHMQMSVGGGNKKETD